MQCPKCNYFMGDLDVECVRCHGKGLQQPVAPAVPSSPPTNNATSVQDSANGEGLTTLYFLSALLPIGGIVLYLANLDKPDRARAAIIGTVIGTLLWLLGYYRLYLMA